MMNFGEITEERKAPEWLTATHINHWVTSVDYELINRDLGSWILWIHRIFQDE